MDPTLDNSGLDAALRCVLEQAAADAAVPGAVAAIRWPRHGVTWSAAAGREELHGDGTALGPDCLFRIASVTKLYVAAAMMRLVESGRVDLQTPLADALGAESLAMLNSAGYATGRITLDMLLSHTSGLPDHVHATDYGDRVAARPAHRWTRAEQVALATGAGLPLGEPGEYFSYADTGYVLLGEAIERLTGESVGAAVRRLLDFGMRGLAHTYWERLEPEPAGCSRRARQYLHEIDATGWDPSFDLHGGGGLVSTVDDLALFAQSLFTGGVFRDPRTLAAGLIVPPARRDPGAYVHSRLAMVLPLGPRLGWGHMGFWGCAVVYCPETGMTVATSINQSRPKREGLLLDLTGKLAVKTEGYLNLQPRISRMP